MSKSKCKASEVVDTKAVVASVKELPGQEISTGTTVTETLAQKVKNAFGEGTNIGKVKAKDFINSRKD